MNICGRRGNCRRCPFPFRVSAADLQQLSGILSVRRTEWDVSDIWRGGTVNVVSVYSSITWREQQPARAVTARKHKGKLLTALNAFVIFKTHFTQPDMDKTICVFTPLQFAWHSAICCLHKSEKSCLNSSMSFSSLNCGLLLNTVKHC